MTDLKLQPAAVDLHLRRGDDISFMLRMAVPGRFVIDGILEADSSTLVSATGDFTDDDIGSIVTAVGLPEATTVLAVTNSTTIELSADATIDDVGAGVFIGTRTVTDLTGYTGHAHVREEPDAEDILAEFTIIIDTGAENGWMTVEMASAIAQELPGVAAWDLELIDPDGKKRTVFAGKCRAVADVTRVVVV